MEQWRASVPGSFRPAPISTPWGPVGEILGLWIHTADSRAARTQRLIHRLEAGAFAMADDD